MNFLKVYEYSQTLIDECQDIALSCKRYDQQNHPFFLEDEFSSKRTLPWLYYATIDSRMTGFISSYSIDSNHVEICCFVLPKYRNQKIFSRLFHNFMNDYYDYSVQLSVTPNNQMGKHILDSLDFDYSSTECSMKLELGQYYNIKNSLRVDKNSIDNALYFTAYNKEVIIGSCTASFVTPTTAAIHDVEILPEFRNKGYGYKMLCQVLNNLFLNCQNTILHVTKENIAAYKLYQKLGFETVEELEYYEKNII